MLWHLYLMTIRKQKRIWYVLTAMAALWTQ